MRVIDVTQDHVFDCIHRVDTAGAALPTVKEGQGYKGSLPHLVRKVLKELGVCYQDYTFVDLGSGKGRTLLIASGFPFRRIIGVEADPCLDAIARLNLARYRTRHQKCNLVTSVCADVRDFELPADPLIIYLFNPFTEKVIRKVLANVQDSLRRKPRPVFMVYLRPLFHDVIEESGVLQRVSYRESRLILNYSYAVYGNVQYLGEATRQAVMVADREAACGLQADARQTAV